MKKTTYLKLIDAVFTGTSFTKKGLLYTWTKVKSTGVIYRNNDDDKFVEIVDKRKINMSSFDGTITCTDDTIQIWEKGVKTSERKPLSKDKSLIKKHFQCSDEELNSLDNETVESLVVSIKKETKKEIVIQPVVMNFSSNDWQELALISSDIESSDGQFRQNDTVESIISQVDKEWMNELIKDVVM